MELQEKRITVSFYKYFYIKEPYRLREILYKNFFELGILGRVYIAHEGINAQISILEKLNKTIKSYLYLVFKRISLNFSLENSNTKKSFLSLKIKVRNRIVSDGIKNQNFHFEKMNLYLNAYQVNNLIDDPNVIILDIRNPYEYEIGHFENAIEIPGNTFREKIKTVIPFFKKKKEKKFLIYCTGGIRCEKFSSWMHYHGFQKVYQIKLGIIGYINEAKKKKLPIRFQGKNFVFDNRMAEKISEKIISNCHQCGKLCDIHVNCKNNFCHFLFIQCVNCAKKYMNCCSFFCMKKIFLLKNTNL